MWLYLLVLLLPLGLSFQRTRTDGVVLPRVSRPSQEVPPEASFTDPDSIVRSAVLEQRDYVWLGSAYAIRPSLIDADGFCAFAECLPDPRNTYQDWPLAVWCAAQPKVGMGYIPEKLFDYRVHQANHSGDARTPDRALRNINRTLNTMIATDKIVQRMGPVSPTVSRAIRRKLRYCEYLLDLYQGARFRAILGFLASQGYVWKGDVSAWKEYARFIGIQLLGSRRFVRLAARW